MSGINNLVDFSEVFAAIRKETREEIKNMLIDDCYNAKHDDDVICDKCQDLILRITGENEETNE